MRLNRIISALGLGLIVGGGLGMERMAQGAEPRPDPKPAEVMALVRQLGDDRYPARQEAVRRLREIGPAALPALRGATTSADPEVRMRASELAEEIQLPPIPRDVPQPPAVGNGGVYQSRYQATERDGVRIVDASDEGRSIHIERYPTGVMIRIRGQIDGKSAEREYRFRDLTELSAANSAVYVLYLKYIHNDAANDAQMNAMLRGRVMRGGLPMPGIFPQPMIIRVPDNGLAELELKFRDHLVKGDLTPREIEDINSLLRQVRDARIRLLDPARVEKQLEEYNALLGELRAKLK